MHLFIIGAPASGKMTIGQELSRLTDATLFYTIKPSICIRNLSGLYRGNVGICS